MSTPYFQKVTLTDIPRIYAIEIAAHPFPWTEGILKDCLRVHYDFWKIMQDNDVVGFGVMTIAVNECHILDIAIDPAFQGKGFGKQLVGFLLNEARKKHAQMIYLEVRASNYKAQELYMKMGFNEIGIRKDYYPTHKNREDAIILGLQLDI